MALRKRKKTSFSSSSFSPSSFLNEDWILKVPFVKKLKRHPSSFLLSIGILLGSFCGYEGATLLKSPPQQASSVSVEKNQWSMCFTPHQKCLPLITNEIARAQKSLDVQAYQLTSQPIAQEIIKAFHRGVHVRVLLDKTQQGDQRSQSHTLVEKGIDVRIDYKPAIAHNKIIVIDGKVTLTGSYNWTNNAEKRNAENLLIIKQEALSQEYIKNFDSRWEQSRAYSKNHKK